MKLAVLSALVASTAATVTTAQAAVAGCTIKDVAAVTNAKLTTVNICHTLTDPAKVRLSVAANCKAGTPWKVSPKDQVHDLPKAGSGAGAKCETTSPCALGTVAANWANSNHLGLNDWLVIECNPGYNPKVAARKCGGDGWTGAKWECQADTKAPTAAPTAVPTTGTPTTKKPTAAPTKKTKAPTTVNPTVKTKAPTTVNPTVKTSAPTKVPTASPSASPVTAAPTAKTGSPTRNITKSPSVTPFNAASLLSPKEFVTVLAVLVCTARMVV